MSKCSNCHIIDRAKTAYCPDCKKVMKMSQDAPTVDVLEQISDEVNKLEKVSDGNKVYVGINDVFDIIDKYKGDKA